MKRGEEWLHVPAVHIARSLRRLQLREVDVFTVEVTLHIPEHRLGHPQPIEDRQVTTIGNLNYNFPDIFVSWLTGEFIEFLEHLLETEHFGLIGHNFYYTICWDRSNGVHCWLVKIYLQLNNTENPD